MAYEVYIDDMLLPIPPQKIPIKYPGQNKTMTLINGDEINLIHPCRDQHRCDHSSDELSMCCLGREHR